MFSSYQYLTEIIYAILDSDAYTLNHKERLITELAENLNFEVGHSGVFGERLRMTCHYTDHNGVIDFIAAINVDSGADSDTQRQRVWVEYKIGKHIID